MNQPLVYKCSLLLEPSPVTASRLSQSTGFELPASYSKFPLATDFTYGNVRLHATLFIHLTPLLPWQYTSLTLNGFISLSHAKQGFYPYRTEAGGKLRKNTEPAHTPM